MRNEALQKVSNIISEAKFIKGDIGELPTALCSRMNDSNKNLALEAIRVTASLATALGPHCKPHTRNIVPGMLTALGDSKVSLWRLCSGMIIKVRVVYLNINSVVLQISMDTNTLNTVKSNMNTV